MSSARPLVHRLGLALLTASVPLIVMVLMLALEGYQWSDHAPVLGDEINYWHQAATWAQAGINGGYYVIDDATARLSSAHFYAWGFGPPVFYGLFAKLFGWPLNGILNVNALFFFLSTAAFVWLARLDARRCITLALLLAVYPALLVYLPTSMLEPVYLGCALILAGGLYRLHRGERATWVIVLTGAVLVFLSIMRFTWGLMFWPYLYYAIPWHRWTSPLPDQAAVPTERRWLWSMVGTMVLTGLFFITYNLTTSPYPYALTIMIGMIRTEPIPALLYYINMVSESVVTFLVPQHLPSIALRWVAASLLVWSVIRRGRARSRIQREAMTLLVYLIGGAFLLGFFIYTTVFSVGFRFFAPYVLTCLALCLAWAADPDISAIPEKVSPRTNRVLALLLRVGVNGMLRGAILLFAVTVPFVLLALDTSKDRVFESGRAEKIETFRQQWADLGITYHADADPWCNTLAYSINYTGEPDRLLALDPGLGLSVVLWRPDQPQRARFLMLEQNEYYAQYPDQDQLTWLADLPAGAIYRNEAVVCP